MSFDIYGEHLQRGDCEVHPWVHEDYPCSICLSENAQRRREKAEEARHWADLESKHYAQLFADEEYESWNRQ